jgi:hypothetical protein
LRWKREEGRWKQLHPLGKNRKDSSQKRKNNILAGILLNHPPKKPKKRINQRNENAES